MDVVYKNKIDITYPHETMERKKVKVLEEGCKLLYSSADKPRNEARIVIS